MEIINLGRVVGNDGADGKSAYQIWLDKGNSGTEQDFLDSLKGKDGINGIDGKDGTNGQDGKDGAKGDKGDKGDSGNDGYTPIKGVDYFDGQDGKDGADGSSGVYIGSGEMPSDCNVQIDPNGEVDNFVRTVNGTSPDANGNVEIEVGEGGGSGKDGETPYIGENGNWWIGDEDTGVSASGFPKELQPLNIKQSSYYTGNISEWKYDGTEAKNLDVGIGFKRYTTDSGKFIYDIEGAAFLYGTFKPHSQQSQTYNFVEAFAFGYYHSSTKVIYIADYQSNKQYRFWFDTAYLNGKHNVIEAPLINTGGSTTELQPLTFTGAVDAVYDGTEPITVDIPTGGGSGGDVEELLIDFTTEEEVSLIHIPLTGIASKIKNATKIKFYIYIPTRPTADEATALGDVTATFYRTWNLTYLFAGKIAPTNAINWTKGNYGYSVTERKNGVAMPVIRQTTYIKNYSAPTTSFINDKADISYEIAGSDNLRIGSTIPLCVGTNIKLWIEGGLQ